MSSTPSPALLSQLLMGALAAYGSAVVLVIAKPALARGAIAVGVGLHLAWEIWRGALIGFFPLTNKAESFGAASLALALVALVAFVPSRAYLLSVLLPAVGAAIAAVSFPQDLQAPNPLLRTAWYPAHVPLSFLAMAVWMAAAGAGLAFLIHRERSWQARVERLALQGFGLWSAAMIFGGIWGVVAWGAAFIWDPKMIWSVILWFHYGAFVHVRYTPSLQGSAWLRPGLAFLGVAWVFIAYVGTSFFFGKSSHAF